ncbi:hypothetical protein TrVE_jg7419 [Triparma verrucosa]|uniref:peptide-methionine (S)-S-oxide reductase n=2 Tax=Triparma TaxID=722752 RepID=A0A9W7BRD8_9STRA|nr:hypothetical protein TrST_g404 [Triparma strigata]GMI09854.1 hypothetical protein TrVE_jg7419 [Triparma verrucosa]
MKLLATLTFLSTATTSTSFNLGRGLVSRNSNFGNLTTRPYSRTRLNLFENIFGSPPSQEIVYSNLKYPANEMAEAALAGLVPSLSSKENLQIATFAGGCFWGLELAYQRLPGVLHTAVGYTQGPVLSPTYKAVCSGGTGHTEAIQVYYDDTCTYTDLLDVFFNRVDITTVNGQGNDRGTQYRTGIYPHTTEQIEEARERMEREGEKVKRVATEIKEAEVFWPAEGYHQQYLEKGGQNAEKNAKDVIRCYG